MASDYSYEGDVQLCVFDVIFFYNFRLWFYQCVLICVYGYVFFPIFFCPWFDGSYLLPLLLNIMQDDNFVFFFNTSHDFFKCNFCGLDLSYIFIDTVDWQELSIYYMCYSC